jgi:hypothetical protein
MPPLTPAVNVAAPLEPSRPPYSNRGVTSGIALTAGASDEPFFDAYCATVYAHPMKVLDYVEQALLDAGEWPTRQEGPPVRFYAHNALLIDPAGQRLAQVRHGGQNAHPFVEVKGVGSDAIAAALRENFKHGPSRLDSAYDLRAPGLFFTLRRIAHDFEARWGLKTDYVALGPSIPTVAPRSTSARASLRPSCASTRRAFRSRSSLRSPVTRSPTICAIG